MFSVELHKKSEQYLKKLKDKVAKKRLISKVDDLKTNPFPRDIVRVQGFQEEKVFRVRVGDYRILYFVIYEKKTVYILKIDKRPRVY